MSTIEKSIEVEVPVRTAYNQWTQFEEFPHFMEGVKEVKQIDDKRLHWKAEIAGKEKEWNAVITEQTPDKRIAWTSTGGAINGGAVTFHRLSDAKSKIMLQLDYNPEGFLENVGDTVGFVTQRVTGDLDRFKQFIEARGQETGAWRGSVK
ncbi:MAG: SRPBCC family protein [Nitrospiraceae bacterium]